MLLGAEVTVLNALADLFPEKPQLLVDYEESKIGSKWFAWFDWYWLNVEGFFESVFMYGGGDEAKAKAYGPVFEGQVRAVLCVVSTIS